MTAISTRTAACDVEYDAKGERKRKHFDDASDAKAFYLRMDKQGRNPKVIGESKQDKLKQVMAARPTLAQVFPVDPISPNFVRTMVATGDPTVTQAQDIDVTTPEQLKLEAKKKVKEMKDAKRLKRLQKQNKFLWLKPDTRTVVGIDYRVPTGAYYERWFLKLSDGCEVASANLTVAHSRDHEEHHIRTGTEYFKDGLTNKQYERVLQRCYDRAANEMKRLKNATETFRASDSVQKEMDKVVSKATLKAEPLTVEQVELAKKIADLANLLCCAPSMFFKLPAKQKKMWIGGADNIDKLDLYNHGIDESQCTIPVMQYATRLHKQMIPRLEIGGPQIGTPELAKDAERKAVEKKAKSEKTVKAPKADGTVDTTPAEPKEAVDAYGNKPSTGCGKINAEIIAAKPGTLFDRELVGKIAKKTGVPHTASHFKTLERKGFLVKLADGFVRKGETPTAKAKAKAKAPVKAQSKKPVKVAKKAAPAKGVQRQGKAQKKKTTKKAVAKKSPKKKR